MKKLCLVLLLICVTAEVRAASFAEWANNRIKAQLAKRDPATQQIDPPASLLPEANVADLAAAADAVSLALAFAGVGEEPKDAQSVTASAYALIVGAHGADPDDVGTMHQHELARRIYLTVGSKQKTDTDPAAHLYQAKWLLYDGRQLTEAEKDTLAADLTGVSESMLIAKMRFTVLTSPRVLRALVLPRYRDELMQHKQELGLDDAGVSARTERLSSRIVLGRRLSPEAGDSAKQVEVDLLFWAGLVDALVAGNFDATAAQLTPDVLQTIDDEIGAELEPFMALSDHAAAITSKARRRPQVALAGNILDPQSADARKTFGVEGIYTRGFGTLWNFTGNAQYKRPEAVNDDDQLTAAVLFRRQTKPKTADRSAMYLDLGGDASLLHDKRTYRAQAKVTISILKGVQVPVSVTWANHSDLVKESNVTGHIGISFDFSKAGDFFKRSKAQ